MIGPVASTGLYPRDSITGSINDPSMAVVAMVEPEIAENTVPATTATTASRPGTWRTRRSIPSITFRASPVWKRTSPISTKSGIGVSEKLITAAALFLSIWLKPASPPRNKLAPTMLIAMNAKATGRPMNRSTEEPPRSSSEASCQDISAPLGRGHRIVPGPPLGQGKTMHAKEKLDAEQPEAQWHRREQPPFRDDQRLDRKRAALEARHRNARSVPDEIEAANHAENVADPFEQPPHIGGQRAQHDVDADVLSLPQQAGSGKERQEIDDVLGDLIARRDAAQTDVAQQHIGADQQRHRQKQKARQQHQRFEQAAVPVRQSRHAGTAPSIATLIGLGEKLLQFCAMLRALADDPRPAGLIGFVVIELSLGALELDRLNAGVSLTFGVLGVLLGENRHRIRFRLLPRLAQNIALGIGEPVPGGFVHQDRHFGGVEAGIDAIFRLLVPAEIEDAGDRPAVSVNDSPLESRINLAGRGLDDRRSERLEKIAVDRSDANLEATEIGLRDRLVEIEVKRISIDMPREEDRVHLFGIEPRHVVVAAVLAQLRHRPFGQLPGVGLGHHIGVESPGRIREIDNAGFERVADLERRHGLRSADIVDLKDALAVAIHPLDEELEAARIGGLFGEGGNRAQGDFLGRCRRCHRDHERAGDEGRAHGISPLRAESLLMIRSFNYNRGGVELSQLRPT